jgi:hypothetical protein
LAARQIAKQAPGADKCDQPRCRFGHGRNSEWIELRVGRWFGNLAENELCQIRRVGVLQSAFSSSGCVNSQRQPPRLVKLILAATTNYSRSKKKVAADGLLRFPPAH